MTTEKLPGLDAAMMEVEGESGRIRCSVLIPTLGWPDSLDKCLQSIESQETSFRYDVTVIVNGPEIDVSSHQRERLRILHEPKSGPAAARNLGVRSTAGEIIAFIDSDCVALPGWLENGVRTISSLQPPSVVAGAIMRPDVAGNFISHYDAMTYLQQEDYVNKYGMLVTANVFVGRDTFATVGPFSTDFPEAAGEDWDWARRAGALQIPVVYCSTAGVLHPNLSTFAELKRKAERMTRGSLIEHRRLGRRESPSSYVEALKQEILKALRHQRTNFAGKARLLSVGILMAGWRWEEAKRWLRDNRVS